MAAPKEFLNPKSMVTPGIAGAMTMMITNTLHQQFGAPVNWTGLTISFVMGLIVFTASTVPLPQRWAFYVINSLVIFSVAVGSSAVGAAAERGSVTHFSPATQFFAQWLR
jgi:hypothetical protein